MQFGNKGSGLFNPVIQKVPHSGDIISVHREEPNRAFHGEAKDGDDVVRRQKRTGTKSHGAVGSLITPR